MEQADVLDLKRRYVRRGHLWWGVPMAAASPLILLVCWSWPMDSTQIMGWLFISALTSLIAFYLGAVWAEGMWLIFKDKILRAAETRPGR